MALTDHEELVFPSPPVAYKKMRSKEVKGLLNTGEGLGVMGGNQKDSQQLSSDGTDFDIMDVEVTCPYCFLALSSHDVEDAKKWRWVSIIQFQNLG